MDHENLRIYKYSIDSMHVACTNMRVCMVITYSKSMDQPCKVANPARGQLNSKNVIFENRSRETDSAVPSRVTLFILHIQAKFDAYSRDSSRFPRRCLFILYHQPPTTGESRVRQVMWLHTVVVHFREATGVGLVVLCLGIWSNGN